MDGDKKTRTATRGDPAKPDRGLLDLLPHGVQKNDCRGTITYSNWTHHEILGYEPGELLGKKVWEMMPSARERAELEEYLARLVREQPAPVPYLTKNRRKDGVLVDLRVDWTYDRTADGALQGFVSVITNATKQRRMDENLRHRTEGLATLLDVSQRLSETLDTQSVLQAAADGVTKLVGLSSAAVYLLEGEALHLRATTPPLPARFPNHLRIAPLADHPHIRDAIESGAPVLVDDFRASTSTLAEREVAEQRNLRTVLFIPLVLDKEAIGAFIVGSTGDPSPISEEEVGLCRTLANLSALAVKNAKLYDESHQRAAELQHALSERIRAEDERERLRAQLNQAQRMESIGRLAGGVAHDFNNMLTVILGQAELALGRLDEDHPLQPNLAQILDAAERSAKLTQQLLAFARKQTIHPAVVDLSEVVGELLKMLRRLIGEDVDLVWSPGRDLGSVMIDPSQVDQILANLCVNARDAISGTGTIAIETGNVVFDDAHCMTRAGAAPGEYVMLAVSDDGCGMNEATRAHLFEPFFTTKDPGAGTGLGLATVYGIVKQNDGIIDVQSEVGRGSTFRIYFRRHKGEAVPAEIGPAEPAPVTGTETILLVEDEVVILNLAAEMLESLGYRVLPASSSEDALALASTHEGGIDLLVTDVVMPGMDGLELAGRLQTQFPRMGTLYVSGYSADIIAHRGALKAGTLLLSKPFSRAALASKVSEALASRPAG